MAKQTGLDWEVVLDDTEWSRSESLDELMAGWHGAQTAAGARLGRPGKVLVAVMGVIVLCAAMSTVVIWRRAEAGYRQIETDLAESVALETWTGRTGNQAARVALLDSGASAAWRQQIEQGERMPAWMPAPQVEVLDVALQDDVAMVTLRLVQPDVDPPTAYRTTRFYRLVAGTWLRTEAVPELSGPAATIETAHFVFHFRQTDRDAVEAVAARVDAIYAQLRRDVGLDVPPDHKLRIDVATDLADGDLLLAEPDHLTVLSPRLRMVPAPTADADILARAIVNQLVSPTMNVALTRDGGIPNRWSLLLYGVQLWQVSTAGESLRSWDQEMLSWLEYDAPAIRRGEREPTAADLARVCPADFVWRRADPLSLSPLALCTSPAWQAQLRLVSPPPQKLMYLVGEVEAFPVRGGWTWGERMAAMTVVEYLVEAHGRDRLPVLLGAMRRYETWGALVPAVTGVTAAEFEVGWQTYVTTRYAWRER